MAFATCSRCGQICPPSYRAGGRRPLARIATSAVVIAAVAVGAAPVNAARANNTRAVRAVLTAQTIEGQQETFLNTCLAASPSKNTPCIRRQALSLSTVADREIKTIGSTLDGREMVCVRTVAGQEIAYLKLWKAGGLALYRNERKKARGLFIKSATIADAQRQIEPGCFALALGGAGT